MSYGSSFICYDYKKRFFLIKSYVNYLSSEKSIELVIIQQSGNSTINKI